MSISLRPAFLTLLSLLVWVSVIPGHGKVFQYTELDCTCEVPDTWTFRDKAGDLIDAVNPTYQKSFLLRVVKISTAITLDNKGFIHGFEQSFITKGFTITDRGMVPLRGVTFYKLDMTKDLGNKFLYVTTYVTLANGYGYMMDCSTYGTSSEDDDELKTIVASFDFINPPKVHINAWTNIFTPHDGIDHDANYLLGYRIGIVLALLAMLACPLITLAGIGIGIYFLVRKKPTPPPPTPPPPPPFAGPPPNFPPL